MDICSSIKFMDKTELLNTNEVKAHFSKKQKSKIEKKEND